MTLKYQEGNIILIPESPEEQATLDFISINDTFVTFNTFINDFIKNRRNHKDFTLVKSLIDTYGVVAVQDAVSKLQPIQPVGP